MVVTGARAAVLTFTLGPWLVLAGEAPVVDVYYGFQNRNQVVDDIQADHIWFNMPSSRDLFNNGVFASTEWYFQSTSSAYMGTQVQRGGFSEYSSAIFSVWDLSPQQKARGSSGCTRFGGEGTGVKCKITYRISPHVKYTLQVQLTQTTAQGQTWTGTISDGRRSTVIGSMFFANARGMQGWGKIEAGSVGGFYENFKRTLSCGYTPFSKVGIIGPFLQQRSMRPISARAIYHKCPQNADCVGSVPGQAGPAIMFSGGKGVVHRHQDGEIWPHSRNAITHESVGKGANVTIMSRLAKAPIHETEQHNHESVGKGANVTMNVNETEQDDHELPLGQGANVTVNVIV